MALTQIVLDKKYRTSMIVSISVLFLLMIMPFFKLLLYADNNPAYWFGHFLGSLVIAFLIFLVVFFAGKKITDHYSSKS